MDRPKKPCAQPGCGALVDVGYCTEHADRARTEERLYDTSRGTTTKRGYDGAWRKFRKWFLSKAEHAVCEDCHRKPSTDVHHKIKISVRPDLRLVESNCLGLCRRCHNIRGARGE